MLAFGSADLLRAWVNTKPERLPTMATQIGLELWKRQGRTMPTCAGLLARTTGIDAQAALYGSARAWVLADRILDLRKENPDLDGNADRMLADLFLHIQWRVAWFCHRRSEQSDRVNDVRLVNKEEQYGTALDASNPALGRIRQRASGLTAWQSGRLMPREGLRIGLERLDFLMARQYAQKVLVLRPEACSLGENGLLDCEVLLSTFMGSYQYYQVGIEGKIVQITEYNPVDRKIYQAGDHCRLSFDPSGVYIL